MHFPPVDFASPLTWLVCLLLILLLVPAGYVLQQNGLTPGRRTIRFLLHMLLWLAVLGLALQPRWSIQLPAGRLLLVADNVPAEVVGTVRDSLGIRAVARARDFRGATDTVVLLGQTFPNTLLAKLAQRVVRWVPYDEPGTLQALTWPGVVRRGEMQTVSGQLARPQEGGTLRLRFGNRVLDSVRITTQNQSFALRYPVFSQGRTSLTLWLNDVPLDTIHFVARPLDRLSVRFIINTPDFETRTLADWLGRQGHRVELTSQLSTGIGAATSINAPIQTRTAPDLLITDPDNIGNALVAKTVAAGKAVLVLNLTRPDADVGQLSRATGARLQLRRIPGKDSLRMGPVLTALPYQLVPAPGVSAIGTYPVAVAPTRTAGSRVAVSWFTETFPLRLSGDSTAYEQLWLSVLATLQPRSTNNVQFNAPLFQDQPTDMSVNNPSVSSTYRAADRLRFGPDTVALRPQVINARTLTGTLRPTQPGWQPLADTLAGYVYSTGTLWQRHQLAATLRAHNRYDQRRSAMPGVVDTPFPDWAWFVLIGVLLAALWLEPKLG